MRKTNYNQDLGSLSKRLRRLSTLQVDNIMNTMLSYDKSICMALVDLNNNKILIQKRLDMLFGLPSNPTLEDFYKLISVEFYITLFKCYAYAAQNILLKNESLSGNFHYKYCFQINTESTRKLGESYKLLVSLESEPIILETAEGDHFACIEKYCTIDMSKDGYFPKPLVINNGFICWDETKELLQIAAPYIYDRLPFTGREIDILEELADGSNTAKIATNLSIAPSTVEGFRRDIRKKVKSNISKELNDIKIASILKDLNVI
jgi:DNA-binding CsgD family transcriptional regulator